MTTTTRPYQSRTNSVLAAEDAAERARRNGLSPVPSRTTPPSTPAGAASATGTSATEVKGAVKVDEFPVKSPYPFQQIAADGGVWKIDPAAFPWRGKPVKETSVRSAAWKWAEEHGVKTKVVIDGGFVYVQFTPK